MGVTVITGSLKKPVFEHIRMYLSVIYFGVGKNIDLVAQVHKSRDLIQDKSLRQRGEYWNNEGNFHRIKSVG